jgi:hypothetical protein
LFLIVGDATNAERFEGPVVVPSIRSASDPLLE